MTILSNIGLGHLINALSPACLVEGPEVALPPVNFTYLRNLPRDPRHSGAPEGSPHRPFGFPAPAPSNHPNV